MQHPRLVPDHQDTPPEPMGTERQMVALIEVMSQIVQAFFERAREGEPSAGAPQHDPSSSGEKGAGVRAAIVTQAGLAPSGQSAFAIGPGRAGPLAWVASDRGAR